MRRTAGLSSASCCSRTCASSPCSCSCRSCPDRRRSTRCLWRSAGRCSRWRAVFLVSRFALPLLLGAVARSGRREAFSLAVVVASVGTGWISSLLGTSMALGAFLGGLCPRGKRVQPSGPCGDPSDSRSAGEPLLHLARNAARRRVPRPALADGRRDDGVHPAAEGRRGNRRAAARRDAASRGCGRCPGALAGRRIFVRVRTLRGRGRAGLCIGLADPARSEHRDDGRDARDDWRGAGNFPPPRRRRGPRRWTPTRFRSSPGTSSSSDSASAASWWAAP